MSYQQGRLVICCDEKTQIPPDLVVKSQAIEIVEVILSRIRRPHVIHTLCRHRKARCELLSTSEAHWFTTKSDGMCKFLYDRGWKGYTLELIGQEASSIRRALMAEHPVCDASSCTEL